MVNSQGLDSSATPTRDEAVPAGWRYSINYGPDGEENYANVYAADGQIVGNLRTHHAIAICNAFAVCDSLTASPPPAASPASPSGDAVHEALREAEAAFETIRVILVNELDEPVRRAFWRAVEARNSLRTLLGFPEPTSLASDATPAATSGSEATCNASLQVAAIPRAENTGRYLAETNDGRLLYLNHANQWQEMPNILAKPASSPAGGDLREVVHSLMEAGKISCWMDVNEHIEAFQTITEALSQSTSAGRVGE